jgi:hypothetical protein
MLYGSQVWWSGKTTSITPILSTYNQIARWITGLPRSTRGSKPLTCANLPLLDTMLNQISTNYAIHLVFLHKTHPAAMPTSPNLKARNLTGTDHILALVEGMYTNRLEVRISLSPFSGSIPAHHTQIHSSRASGSEATTPHG